MKKCVNETNAKHDNFLSAFLMQQFMILQKSKLFVCFISNRLYCISSSDGPLNA